jgi:3-mercaptopyruvate sulfurtransferase SseA
MDALSLHLTGYDNVAIYDGSLHEWGRDGSLLIEFG